MCRSSQFLILFIAAATINVLVAWSCISWSPYTSHSAPSDKRSADGYPSQIAGPYGQKGWWFTAAGVGAWQSVPYDARGVEGEFVYWRNAHTPAYYRGGWPMYSLQSTITSHDNRARWELPLTEILRRGIQTSFLPRWLHAHKERRLPIVPSWAGFAVNTLLYFFVLVAARLLMLRALKRTPRQGTAATSPPPIVCNTIM
jgi:hypothetical protein